MPRIPAKYHHATLSRLGQKVRMERLRRKLTQEELAERAGIHPRMLQKIEAGESNILVTTIIRLHAALGCAWTDLMPDASAPEA